MKKPVKIALLGATGKAGQYLLQELLTNGISGKISDQKTKKLQRVTSCPELRKL